MAYERHMNFRLWKEKYGKKIQENRIFRMFAKCSFSSEKMYNLRRMQYTHTEYIWMNAKAIVNDTLFSHRNNFFECSNERNFHANFFCRDRESEAHDDAVYSTIQNSNIKLPIGRFFSPLSLSSERLFLLFVFERVGCIWWWWWCMQKYIKNQNQIQTEQKTIK